MATICAIDTENERERDRARSPESEREGDGALVHIWCDFKCFGMRVRISFSIVEIMDGIIYPAQARHTNASLSLFST